MQSSVCGVPDPPAVTGMTAEPCERGPPGRASASRSNAAQAVAAAPVSASSIGLLALAACTAWYGQRLNVQTAEAVTSSVASIRAAHQLESGLRESRKRHDGFLLSGDRHLLEPLPDHRRATDQWR